MTDEVFISGGIPIPEKGVYIEYVLMNPDQTIIKAKGTLKGKKAHIKAVVDVGYTGTLEYDEKVTLADGDYIVAEPDGLAILRTGASIDNVEPIEGQHVVIGFYFQGLLTLRQTVEPNANYNRH